MRQRSSRERGVQRRELRLGDETSNLLPILRHLAKHDSELLLAQVATGVDLLSETGEDEGVSAVEAHPVKLAGGLSRLLISCLE